ncbi:MarR family winged helix-turn-helix transcriptional regulator [Candidatus Neomarinimicrobiota bacterium]
MSYTKNEIDSYDYDRDYFQPIVEVYLLSNNHYKKYFAASGLNLTPQQWHALNRLWMKDGMSQAELAKKIFRDYPFTTRLVDVLEKKGFVVRSSNTGDRRVKNIFLTKNGKEFKYQAYPLFLNKAKSLRAGLSDSELLELKRICGKIRQNYIEAEKY